MKSAPFCWNVIFGLCCATALSAQEIITTPIDEIPEDELIGRLITTPTETLTPNEMNLGRATDAVVVEAAIAQMAELRVLDKLTGAVTDLTLGSGATSDIGFLTVAVSQCRYPQDNPVGDAYVYVAIGDNRTTEVLFRGWMIASAPALNALDHPRYDVWALRCITS